MENDNTSYAKLKRMDVKISSIASKRTDIDNITSKLRRETKDREGIQPNTGKGKMYRNRKYYHL